MADLISRQEAVEALFDWEMIYNWDDHCREEDLKPAYIVSPSDVIEQLPPAQPERKTGKWYIDAEGDVRCTACKTKCLRDDIGINILSNYCPSCGAHMRGEEHDK